MNSCILGTSSITQPAAVNPSSSKFLTNSFFISPILRLPEEIMFRIFELLSPIDQSSATCVCKSWKLLGNDPRLKEIRDICFGKAKWGKYFGNIGEEPIVPYNIRVTLNKNCIFWPEKKAKETHLLVLIPETLNKEKYHLVTFKKIIHNIQIKNGVESSFFDRFVKEKIGGKSEETHWTLITRHIIPGSLGLREEEQRLYVNNIAYELPKVLDIATATLMHYMDKKKLLYCSNKGLDLPIYTRCQENVNDYEKGAFIVFRGIGPCGYTIEIFNSEDQEYVGMACSLVYRKFFST